MTVWLGSRRGPVYFQPDSPGGPKYALPKKRQPATPYKKTPVRKNTPWRPKKFKPVGKPVGKPKLAPGQLPRRLPQLRPPGNPFRFRNVGLIILDAALHNWDPLIEGQPAQPGGWDWSGWASFECSWSPIGSNVSAHVTEDVAAGIFPCSIYNISNPVDDIGPATATAAATWHQIVAEDDPNFNLFPGEWCVVRRYTRDPAPGQAAPEALPPAGVPFLPPIVPYELPYTVGFDPDMRPIEQFSEQRRGIPHALLPRVPNSERSQGLVRVDGPDVDNDPGPPARNLPPWQVPASGMDSPASKPPKKRTHHELRRPRKREKEVKKRYGRRLAPWVADMLGNTVLEFIEIVDILHDALPRELQATPTANPRLWGKATGVKIGNQWRPPTVEEKGRAVAEHLRELDVNKVVKGLIYNQLEDYVYGRIGRRIAETNRQYGLNAQRSPLF